MNDREFWMLLRQYWLGMVSAIERKLGLSPTTKEMVDWYKQQR